MADIFSRTVGFGGAFAADAAVITFTSMAGIGLLAQSVSWQYQQNVQRVYEIGSSNVWLVAGRTQGQASVQRIMGPTAVAASFFTSYGSVCNATSNSISFSTKASCGGASNTGTTSTITMSNCVIQSYGGGVQAEQMIVNEQIGVLFLSLSYT